MARSYSAAVRNAMLDAYEVTIGSAPLLRFYSGAMPANCAAATTGTLLASITLPADWMAAASAGAKALAGSWAGAGVAGAGAGTNIGYFRIFDASGTICHDQGTVTAAGGGGDMTLNNINIADAQPISVSAFAFTGIA
jgi:hypothetical protein